MLAASSIAPVDYFIVDGMYVAARSFFATPPLTAPDGTPTNCLFGFLGAMERAIADLRPKHIIVANEGARGTRDELFSDYKANRTEFPQELKDQLQLLFPLCGYLGWSVMTHAGAEADDVIASICTQWEGTKAIFTTDKDLHTLVNDHTFIYKREKKKSLLSTVEDITAKWGVPPKAIADILLLAGDSIDNIPGVDGIGLKTATRLIQTYGSVDNLLLHQSELPVTLQKKLQLGAADLELSRKLIQMNTALPIALGEKPDFEAAGALFSRLNMKKAHTVWLTPPETLLL
jgi:DNA polymerase-1